MTPLIVRTLSKPFSLTVFVITFTRINQGLYVGNFFKDVGLQFFGSFGGSHKREIIKKNV